MPKVSSPSLLMSVWNFLKDKARSPEQKALIKAGFVNENGDLTSEGKDALVAIAYEKFESDLVTLAVDMNAKAEKDAKKA